MYVCLQLLPTLCCAVQLPTVSHLGPSRAAGTSTLNMGVPGGGRVVCEGGSGGRGREGGRLLVCGPCDIQLSGTTG